jgi:hypothetical protein
MTLFVGFLRVSLFEIPLEEINYLLAICCRI